MPLALTWPGTYLIGEGSGGKQRVEGVMEGRREWRGVMEGRREWRGVMEGVEGCDGGKQDVFCIVSVLSALCNVCM